MWGLSTVGPLSTCVSGNILCFDWMSMQHSCGMAVKWTIKMVNVQYPSSVILQPRAVCATRKYWPCNQWTGVLQLTSDFYWPGRKRVGVWSFFAIYHNLAIFSDRTKEESKERDQKLSTVTLTVMLHLIQFVTRNAFFVTDLANPSASPISQSMLILLLAHFHHVFV